MSIDRRDYIIVGLPVKSISEHYNGDAEDFCSNYYFEKEIGEMVFIHEYYDSDNLIIGEILQTSDGYNQGLDYAFFANENEINDAKVRVSAFIKEHLNIDSEPHVIVKTQFS